MELAKNNSCGALRLDTGSQNIPALSLYKKLGFQIAATASMKVGATIDHSGHFLKNYYKQMPVYLRKKLRETGSVIVQK